MADFHAGNFTIDSPDLLVCADLQIASSGEGFEGRFLTLAAELHEGAKWQKLIKELELADSNSPAQFESADSGY